MSTLKTFIQALDPKTLPRVLRILSGVYYQGSIYELFGNECCLPTGEEIKVIGIKINKITASFYNKEDNKGQETIDLPLDFPGFFQIEADTTPFLSIEEIASTVPIGTIRFGHPCYYSPKDVKLPKIIIKSGEKIMFHSVGEVDGVMSVNCEVLRDGQHHPFALALSCRGEFFECSDDQIYSLNEIAEWKIPRNRKRTVLLHSLMNTYENTASPFPDRFKGSIVLSTVYELQAVMKFRKDIVHILSDLDVEVKDVTEHCDMKCFVQAFSLFDIYERTSMEFPMVAEVIEEPVGKHKSYNSFKHGHEIVFHTKVQALRTLASEVGSDSPKKHFLIPKSYSGKFKRRPRTFHTAYDLHIARRSKEPLHVVATKAFCPVHEELSSILVGDQLLVLQRESLEFETDGRKTAVDVLACEKFVAGMYEKSFLPMYAEGHFVEVIHDKKQYSLAELCQAFPFPFNVKVSVRDLNTMGDDILAAIPCIQLEEQITDAYLLVSTHAKPEEIWEIPVYRMNMSVQLVNKPVEAPALSPSRTHVEEITEEQYYMVRRYEKPAQPPPPRPPKMPLRVSTKARFLCVPVQTVSNPPRSPKGAHPESSKRIHSRQAAAAFAPDLKITCPQEVPGLDTERIPGRGAPTTETSITREDYTLKEAQIKQDYEYFDETVIDEIRKKLKDRTFHTKSNLKKTKDNI
ncbi:protein THEMIS [Ambystoma mexicanum]|uniref:protein THEMIS n=1 Tax=Ambystoma mexicanum TaxID=8296 RepID=UPI0037E943F8